MKDTTFAYYHHKLDFLFAGFFAISGFFIQFSDQDILSTSYIPLIGPVVMYGSAVFMLIRGIIWFFSPPVLSGNDQEVHFKTSIFQSVETFKWQDIQTIQYRIKIVGREHSRNTKDELIIYGFHNRECIVNFNLIPLTFNNFRSLAVKHAPHIQWIYPE